MSATEEAFNVFRADFELKELDPARVNAPDELYQLTPEQGLEFWQDGPLAVDRTGSTMAQPEMIAPEKLAECRLWAVRVGDTVAAREYCEYASKLTRKLVKHSNLTGGEAAYSAGEMLFIAPDTIVVNGRSGRYGAVSPGEMDAVALAFCRSGYHVWSMGWDDGAGAPAPFVGKIPIQVTP